MLGRTYTPKKLNYSMGFSVREIIDDTGEKLIVLSDVCRILQLSDSPSSLVRSYGLMHSIKAVKEDDGVRSYRNICIGKSALLVLAAEISKGDEVFDWLLTTVYHNGNAVSSTSTPIKESPIRDMPKKQETPNAITQCLDSMIYQIVMLKNALTV